ncbi:hypothetical protein CRYUN_Cryun18bG0015100 [Craigia yunnanensis]
MEPQFSKPRSYGPPLHHNHQQQQLKMTIPSATPQQHSDDDRSSSELRAVDCNLNSLCEHIQMEGFNGGSFSDIVVNTMGSTYHLHRLILSRSSYFRNMLHGPRKDANAPIVTLNVDDNSVNGEAIAIALAYLYGHHPKLNDSNAFRVLAAASFLDLQDLCAICTDFIISELWTSNFLAYQMLLSQRVQEIGANTCKNCCHTSMQCACRQPLGFPHAVATTGYYVQEHKQNHLTGNIGNVYVADNAEGEGNGLFRPVRVHVRGAIDALAGTGRGATFVPATAWPPTRFVFSRVPFGMGNRNGQQSLANDDSETRADHNGDMSGGGLTALVELSQGGNDATNVHGEQTERSYETDLQSRVPVTSVAGPATSGIALQMLESPEHAIGIEWENATSSSISLDMKTRVTSLPFVLGLNLRMCTGSVMVKSSTLQNSFMLVLYGRLAFRPLMTKILKDVGL